ncbi:MAG TPA: DUF433 domain-containing protein [Desulfobacterales bacterium]|nr:MAG: antitoxin [Deltaproteobacteria bacterium]HHC25033.1 DUF433 domain-containing protein [Desulfobacterales bacterium]
MKSQIIGRYIVADPKICHGKPTFRGTRIMVADVLEQVAEGLAWESIIEGWHDSISREAIAEALQLAGRAFLSHSEEFAIESPV